MPETPDLDTLDLPGLLALWAERYPSEVLPPPTDTAWQEDRYRLVVGGSLLLAGSNWEAYDLWMIEGHARACILRLGWGVGMSVDQWGARAEAWPRRNGVSSTQDPSPAACLVRLRLSLPAPSADADR